MNQAARPPSCIHMPGSCRASEGRNYLSPQSRRSPLVAHIVTANCNDCKYTDCCVVCPVECFYQDEMMLYIDPVECIDCEACVPECPVQAIFAQDDCPEQWQSYIQLNTDKSAEFKITGHITEKQDAKEGPTCKKP